MKRIALLVLLIAFVFAFDDPCSPIRTCPECVSHKFCGWCSQPINYQDGTMGKQCAYQGDGAKPFICQGTYQTETCIPEYYTCDNRTFSCKQSKVGFEIEKCIKDCVPPTFLCDEKRKICYQTVNNGSSKEVCEQTCGKPPEKKFNCDVKTLKCEEAKEGTVFQVCNETCGKSHNVTPDFQGKWRGIQISIGYKRGEWKMDVTKDSAVTILNPDKSIWAKGTLQQMQNELWIVESTGVRRSLFVINQLPTTKAMTLAVGNKGLPPPPDFDTAMKSTTPGTVFLFWKCISEANCDFSQVSKYADNLLQNMKRSQDNIDDKCSEHPDCISCIGDKANKCGWCSQNVIYKNGTVIGKHCAGHNGDGSKEPFICNGIYSTETCNFPTTTASTGKTTSKTTSKTSGSSGASTSKTTTTGGGKKKYDCSPSNATCVVSNNGAYNDINDCQAQCKTTPIPNDLVGVWRGIQVNKNYIVGEWRAVITPTNVTITRPDGEKIVGSLISVGMYITIDPLNGPLKGKKIQTMWQIQFGPETKELTWAWGSPGGSAPTSYDSAMIEPNNAEFALASCVDGKDKSVCLFDH